MPSFGTANKSEKEMKDFASKLHGRTKILVDDVEVDRSNVIDVLSKALEVHKENLEQIDYLFEYYRGNQPSLYRKRETREEITSKVVENHASEIVDFKTGYLCSGAQAIQYTCKANPEDSDVELLSSETAKLNQYMTEENKATKDKEVIDWENICGVGYKMALPKVEMFEEDECPFNIYTLDPRQTFVVYSNILGQPPLMGVYYVKREDDVMSYACYTKENCFIIEKEKDDDSSSSGGSSEDDKDKYSIKEASSHILREIPIIEYVATSDRMGAFEPVITLLDAKNQLTCDRLEGTEGTVQSLLKMHNCDMTDEQIDNFYKAGAVSYSDVSPDRPADVSYLTLELDQSQAQILANDIYQTILQVVGMPSMSDGNTSDSSNNGAVILKQGWSQAEARAKGVEEMFKVSERRFLSLVLGICADTSSCSLTLRPRDVQIQFTRRNYEDIMTKVQVFTMLSNNPKVSPKIAYDHSGLFIDPERAYLESKPYIDSLTANESASDISETNKSTSKLNESGNDGKLFDNSENAVKTPKNKEEISG